MNSVLIVLNLLVVVVKLRRSNQGKQDAEQLVWKEA